MANLAQKSKKVFALVMPSSGNWLDLTDYEKELREYLDGVIHWAYAYHLQEMDMETGEMKRPHIHIYIEYHESERIGKRLKELATVYQCNKMAVSIQAAKSEVGSIQYLIHKKNPEKQQYDKSIIFSNYSKDDLETILNADDVQITFDRLRSLCCSCRCISDVAEVIGISYYRAYRPVIYDIWNDVHKRDYWKSKKNQMEDEEDGE